jgi:hypothetical protein
VREKGNANSNSMMNEEKLQIEVSLMQPRKDAYAHTGLQDDEFQFLRESFADLFQRCTIDTNCGTQRGSEVWRRRCREIVSHLSSRRRSLHSHFVMICWVLRLLKHLLGVGIE